MDKSDWFLGGVLVVGICLLSLGMAMEQQRKDKCVKHGYIPFETKYCLKYENGSQIIIFASDLE